MNLPTNYNYEIFTTNIKNQGNYGTCWAYSTLSFIESECIRDKTVDVSIDLSEWYFVYFAFVEKSKKYLKKMGHNFFREGGLCHDIFYLIKKYGIVREEDYNTGLQFDVTPFGLKFDSINKELFFNPKAWLKSSSQHANMLRKIISLLDRIIEKYMPNDFIPDNVIEKCITEIKDILNNNMGIPPQMISFGDQEISPIEYSEEKLLINKNNYITITSFISLPINSFVTLNLPDNWLGYSDYLNIKLEDMYEIVKYSIMNNYSVVFDGDISNDLFKPIEGYAIVQDFERIDDYKKMEKLRLRYFLNHTTTDDHLMHIVGYTRLCNRDWFLVKNSWGTEFQGENIGTSNYEGFIHMSEYYLKINVISITIHKDVLQKFSYHFGKTLK